MAPLALTGCRFSGNEAHAGGALCLQEYVDLRQQDGTLRIIANKARGAANVNDPFTSGGGAISVIQTTGEGATVSLIDVTFNTNEADADGGAIQMIGGELRLQGIPSDDDTSYNFLYNTATGNGGAIALHRTATSAPVMATIQDAKFSYNTAGANGGAIYSYNSNLMITASDALPVTLDHNTASNSGGALAAEGLSMISVANVAFQSNEANTLGGGIYATTASAQGHFVDGCSFVSNSARSGKGGAMAFDTTSAVIGSTYRNSTFQYNTAVYGGAIYLYKSAVGATLCWRLATSKVHTCRSCFHHIAYSLYPSHVLYAFAQSSSEQLPQQHLGHHMSTDNHGWQLPAFNTGAAGTLQTPDKPGSARTPGYSCMLYVAVGK